MLKFTKDDFVDVESYDRALHHNGYILYDSEHMKSIYNFEKVASYSYQCLAKDVMIQHSGGFYASLEKLKLYNYLTRVEGCPEHYFNKRGVQGISIDKNKVLSKLASNGYAEEFFKYYMVYRNKEANCNKIRKVLDECWEIVAKNREGRELARIPYSVNQQQNLRFNYRDRDVVALPKMYGETFSTEDGYFLVWGDFAQSDFRIAYNLFLRDENNVDLMAQVEDKYEGLARLVAESEGRDFDQEVFKRDRKLYKTLTLACMYGTRDTVEKTKKPFVKMMNDFLRKCPRYVEFEKRIRDRVELGLPFVVESYFGHQEILTAGGNGVSIVDKALNTPIQSGTSEVIILTVNKILEIFKGLGYSDDDVSVYMVRHDEPIFRLSEKVKKDLWVFEQATDILVDDWLPLHISFSPGYYYGVEDRELQKVYKNSCLNNFDKIEILEKGEGKDYFPLRPVLHLAVGWVRVGEQSVVCFYDTERALADVRIVRVEEERLPDYVFSKFPKIEEGARKDFFATVVYNNVTEDERFVNDNMFFKVVQEVGYRPAMAEQIARRVAQQRFGVDCLEGGLTAEGFGESPVEVKGELGLV